MRKVNLKLTGHIEGRRVERRIGKLTKRACINGWITRTRRGSKGGDNCLDL